MINRVGTVSIFVEDQDRAKAFYTEKLGMECTADNEMWPGADCALALRRATGRRNADRAL